MIRESKGLIFENENYIAKTIERIVFLLHDHQTEIQTLKQQGFTVIGYARKSKSGEDIETRTRLLNLMCKRLKERSLVDHVFVSYTSQANDQLAKRDLNQTSETYKGLHAEGSTQGKQVSDILYIQINRLFISTI